MEGHSVIQLQLIFHPLNTNHVAAYVQWFNVIPQQGNTSDVYTGMGMYLL